MVTDKVLEALLNEWAPPAFARTECGRLFLRYDSLTISAEGIAYYYRGEPVMTDRREGFALSSLVSSVQVSGLTGYIEVKVSV